MKMLKEGGLIMFQTKYLILLIVLLLGCQVRKKLKTGSKPFSNSLFERVPTAIKYDTLNAIFFYENSITAYEEVDVFLKNGGFIRTDEINEKSYRSGYYVGDANAYVQYLKQKGIVIRYDNSSIAEFYDSLFQKGLRDGSYRSKTNINPFCGAYYKKFQLKVEVLFIDTISQRTPLFLNCEKHDDYIRYNKGKNYLNLSLPTYLITNVFSWKEL